MPTKRYHYIIIILVSTILLISTAKAITIDVPDPDPKIIVPGGSTTITVYSSDPGEGKMWVKPPDTPMSSVDILSSDWQPTPTDDPHYPSFPYYTQRVYPNDFPPEASTDTLGEYEVHVVIHDRSAAKSFWVSWNVVPVSPIGSIGLLLTLFAAFGTYALTKRKTLVKV